MSNTTDKAILATDKMILACAEVVHEANRIYCEAIGDTSQVPFKQAPAWQRDSAIDGVIAALNGATPRELHENWCATKRADGWVFGTAKDADAKTHPCLVPYAELPPQQQAKDRLFGEVVRAMSVALNTGGST